MSSLFRQMIAELHQLSTQEKLQMMSHLLSDLQNQAASLPIETKNTSENTSLALDSGQEKDLDAFMQELEGEWGHLSREEVDAQLGRQRLFDWGE